MFSLLDNKYINELYLMYANPLNWGYILRSYLFMAVCFGLVILFMLILVYLFGLNMKQFGSIYGVFSPPKIYVGDGVWF